MTSSYSMSGHCSELKRNTQDSLVGLCPQSRRPMAHVRRFKSIWSVCRRKQLNSRELNWRCVRFPLFSANDSNYCSFGVTSSNWFYSCRIHLILLIAFRIIISLWLQLPSRTNWPCQYSRIFHMNGGLNDCFFDRDG